MLNVRWQCFPLKKGLRTDMRKSHMLHFSRDFIENSGSTNMRSYKNEVLWKQIGESCERERSELDGSATNQNSILGRRVIKNKGCSGIKRAIVIIKQNLKHRQVLTSKHRNKCQNQNSHSRKKYIWRNQNQTVNSLRGAGDRIPHKM